jgi:hypothetical protein
MMAGEARLGGRGPQVGTGLHRTAAVVAALLTLIVTGTTGTASGAAFAAPSAPGSRTVLVGAASRSVLPTVDGSYDYLDVELPAPDDRDSLGVFVPEWDQGVVAVGNGDDRSFWVHDDLRVRAMAVDDPRSDRMVVLVASDLYMIFRADGDEIRARVAERLPSNVRKPVDVLIAATHNHHGPDTAFDVNHTWYEHMVDQAADAVVDAIARREPATLRVASGEHWFGADDGTDPQIIDPTMNVLQATARSGRVIATVVQWNNHPESTLGWEPPVPSDDCAALTGLGQTCDGEGRYFTADFPGVLATELGRQYGGEVLYFSGALGVIIGPGGAPVWEVDAAHPLGNEYTPPPGAVAADGSTDYAAENFRRATIIGEQAAAKASALVEQAEPVRDTRIRYTEQPFFTRLSNIGFRFLLTVGPDGRTQLGHNVPALYECPATGPKTEANCTSDEMASVDDPVLGEVRAGDHLRSSVGYLTIGSDIAMVMMPAEMAGELVVGLPADFRTDPERWYAEPLDLHAFGADFQTPGFIRDRVAATHLFTIGLGNDELGYVLPISEWRVYCVADLLTGEPGTCAALNLAGAIEYPDAVAGATCKALAEDPSVGDALEATYGPDVRLAVEASCRYGQALGEAVGHYEETNAAGWDLAEDILAAVAVLTGDASTEQVNGDFEGYWPAFPPPG